MMNEKLHEIIDLYLKLNPTATRQEKTGNKPTVFINFSGQVGTVEIDVHENGWYPDSNPTIRFNLFEGNEIVFNEHDGETWPGEPTTMDNVIEYFHSLCAKWGANNVSRTAD